MVLYYILWANGLTAENYRIGMLRDQLNRLTETNGSLQAQKSLTEDPVAALQFAQDQHMVQASNISYVFESGNVALQK